MARAVAHLRLKKVPDLKGIVTRSNILDILAIYLPRLKKVPDLKGIVTGWPACHPRSRRRSARQKKVPDLKGIVTGDWVLLQIT